MKPVDEYPPLARASLDGAQRASTGECPPMERPHMTHNQSNQNPGGQSGHDPQTDPGEQAPGRGDPNRGSNPGQDQNEEE